MATVEEIAELLNNRGLQESQEIRSLLRKVVDMMIQGGDLTPMVTPLVKLLASHDVLVKKIAYLFISSHCDTDPDAAFLVANTLQKDCKDPNPIVRSVSVATFCSLPGLSEYSRIALETALKDGSPKVRRAAVIGCGRLFEHSPNVILEHGFIDKFYEMIRDPDPIVVASSLSVLDTVLCDEGGVVINQNIAKYLLKRLSEFTEFNLCSVLQLLLKYKPQTEEEVFNIMNYLDKYLVHKNSAVTVSCIQLFLELLKNLPHLKTELLQRIQPHLVSFLTSSNAELAYFITDFMRELGTENLQLLSGYFKHVFPRQKDPVLVKIKKLSLLPQICSESNMKEVLEELFMYCTDTQVGFEAVEALCSVPVYIPAALSLSVEKLEKLLSINNHILTCNILQSFQKLNVHESSIEKKKLKEVTTKIVNNIDTEALSPETQTALSWILGEYGECIEEAPYVFEKLLSAVEDMVPEIKAVMLTAMLKLFLKRPAECQDMLGHLLEACIKSHSTDISKKALLYYYLLQKDLELLKSIILGNETVKS